MAANSHIRARGVIAWLVTGLIFAVPAIAIGTFNVVGAFAFDRYSFAQPVDGPIRDLTVHNSAGSVRVEAVGGTGASIVGRVLRGLNRPTEHEHVNDGHLVIDAECPAINLSNICSLNLTISVPRGLPMTVDASGGGITVDGSTGALDLSSSGGGVHVSDTSGPLKVDSSGGGVTATDIGSATVDATSSGGGVHLTFAVPPSDVQASSSGGGVTVVVPETTDEYAVDASSSGGSSHVAVRTSSVSPRKISAHSSGGGVSVQYPT